MGRQRDPNRVPRDSRGRVERVLLGLDRVRIQESA